MSGKLQPPDPTGTGDFLRNLSGSGLMDAAVVLPGFAGDLPGGRHVGNYEILDRLGTGGMGTVYRARHRWLQRIVALKVLARSAAGSGPFADLFRREVEAIARLQHPNVVMAYDAGESEAGPYLAMEFVAGRDLASEVQVAGPLATADAVDCALQAARGLEYAHARGIVHRDIKPGNLLRDAAGVVKVADLGLARFGAPDAPPGGGAAPTPAGEVMGTPDYMSPEQAVDSGRVDPRADVYSLGCTLYFLLTGRPPYRAGSVRSLLLAHRCAPLPDPARERPDVPAELVRVFRRTVAKAPEDRHQSMAELVRELEGLRITPAAPPAGPAPQPDGLANTVVLPRGAEAATFRDPGPLRLPPATAVDPARTRAGCLPGATAGTEGAAPRDGDPVSG